MYNMFERTIVNTICYRTFNDETYLFCVCYMPFEKVEKKVEEINKNKPEKINDDKIDWTYVKEFFASQQEDF